MDNRAQAQSHSAGVVWSSKSIAAAFSSRVLLFQCDEKIFGIATDAVVEVIESPEYLKVAGAPLWFEGCVVYQSTPVPVINTGKYFDHEPAIQPRDNFRNAAESRRAIVVKLAGSYFLLAADKVMNLVNLPSDATEVTGAGKPLAAGLEIERHRAIQRVCHYEGRSIPVIDLPELLRLTKLLRECR